MNRVQLKRTLASAAAATAVATTAGVGAAPVMAQPDSASEAQQQLQDLSRKAEKLTEDQKKAEDDHKARQADLERATAEADTAQQVAEGARGEEQQFRGGVDQFTRASYQGARMNKLSALLVSENPDDYLDRAATLDVISRDNNEAISRLADATSRAEKAESQAGQARDRAAKAEADSARIAGEITEKKAAADAKIEKVKEQYEQLSPDVQESMSDSSSMAPLGGSGAAVEAVNAALSVQGSPYVFGAKGPDQFDCSGLVQWAYEQAGVEVSSSTQSQVSEGESVSESEAKPGDIVFFYDSASHNGLYIGDGQIVHAPTEGQTVTVEQMDYMGEVNDIRRVAG